MSGRSNAAAVFSAYARDYNAPRQGLIPPFDELDGSAEMLDQPRVRLGTRAGQTHTQHVRDPLPDGPDAAWWRSGVFAAWRPTA